MIDVADDTTTEQRPVITGAMLPFRGATPEARHNADADVWLADLIELRALGFTAVDLTDSWVRPGDLTPERLDELVEVIRGARLTAPAISAIRRSVIDPVDGDANLEYSHRTIDAAAHLGCDIVSVGLHRPLTAQQRAVLWFWTVDGPHDDDTRETMTRAANRLRELGRHAESVGIVLSLEMYENTLLGTAASAVRLLEEIEHDHVGLNPDIGNLVRQQGPIESIDEMHALCLPHTNYWHMKNYTRFERPTSGLVLTSPSSMADGVINYRRAVAVAAEVGFDGPFCIEHYGGDMLSMMETNLRYAEGLLSRSGSRN